MTQTNTKINKLYYFVSDTTTIYRIADSNDLDKCGICPSHDSEGNVKEDTALAAIFPYIKLTYSTDKATGLSKYLWLQNYIQDGDEYKENKFVCKAGLHDDDSTTFKARHVNEYKKGAIELIRGGYNKDQVRAVLPKYFKGVPYDDIIDGEKVRVTATDVGNDNLFLSDAKIDDLYKEAAEKDAKKAANNILAINGKQVDTLTITTKAK